MREIHFDALSKAIFRSSSRRALASRIWAIVMAGAVVNREAGEASTGCRLLGAKCKRRAQCCSRICKRGRCRCGGGAHPCGGSCVDLSRDLANCGACGRLCRNATNCLGGECICSSGRIRCATDCVLAQTDRDHCGACGNACRGNERCTQGICCDPVFRETISKEPLCCPRSDICGGEVCCFPGDECINDSCCGPGYLTCQGGTGQCCPPGDDYHCCGRSCCFAFERCCGETCCRDGTLCCPDDPGECCTEDDVCPDGSCGCYADRFLFAGKCYARAGHGGGGFRRARGFV
jgi:hypothetical protein